MSTTVSPHPLAGAISSFQNIDPKGAIYALQKATGGNPFSAVTLGKSGGACAKTQDATGCLEIKDGQVIEGEFYIGIGANNIRISDFPGLDDIYKECDPAGTSRLLSLEEALGEKSKTVEQLFRNSTYTDALTNDELQQLMILRGLIAEEVSSKDAIGTRLDPSSMFFPGVIHSFSKVSSTFSSMETISFLVGNEQLLENEALPSSVANDTMIKVSTQGDNPFPSLIYLDLNSDQKGTIYYNYYSKGTPSWASIPPESDIYKEYLNKIKEILEKSYTGNSETNGKIQAYEGIKYINSILESNNTENSCK